MSNDRLWHTKLAARLHDPGEKALVLFRDPAGHEGGTVRILNAWLALEQADSKAVKRADWWAAAADRPQWPRDQWAQVRWTKDSELIHPVSGTRLELADTGRLTDTEIDDVKDRSLSHFQALADAVQGDPRRTLLAYWRFGPELREEEDFGKLGALWEQLPADTRVPDHSIWEHLDLTSAFAGAAAADDRGEVALLALAVGPVQSFIASARSTSDLWAGSHLLARLSWEAMKPLCEALGPDAVLFPRLRGVPQVDLWLRDQGLPDELFANAPWKRGGTDANPLFVAALPNRFVAVVPAGQARELAKRCAEATRDWLQSTGRIVVQALLETAGEDAGDESLYCFQQMRRQLEGFPEVHWAAVPFSLIATDGDKASDHQPQLSAAMEPFFGEAEAGFLSSPAWQVLKHEIQLEQGVPFFQPNPGVLYPAIYELAERVLAAAKSVRPFGQMDERGWRCSLTGETEWLTTDETQLFIPPGSRTETLWTKVAEKRPAWARKGEHLGALPAIKRLWPTLFAKEVSEATGKNIGRFVVSTHTMAVARQLDWWMEHNGLTTKEFVDAEPDREPVALPQRLLLRHQGNSDFKRLVQDAKKILALLEQAQECDSDAEAERLRRIARDTLGKGMEMPYFRLETYYGLLLMDGDRMGAILSGEAEYTPTYLDSFHSKIREGFEKRAQENSRLEAYGTCRRAVSPARHMAISGALNDFSLHIVPHIVQREYLGRLIYGGGDDVLAMFPVVDLLPAAARLRDAWSGRARFCTSDESDSQRQRLWLGKGYARLDGRLLRMMGQHATASAGLVVAHHQAPLSRVLREVRTAEQAAKETGGRDALCLRILKRSGGALELILKWDQTAALNELVEFLRDPDVSRRAAYHSVQWLRDLPEPERDGEMLTRLLAFQFQRQGGDEGKALGLARKLAELALGEPEGRRRRWLENLLSCAEFLARETRSIPTGRRSTGSSTGEAA